MRINPNPLRSLNHLTVPLLFTPPSFRHTSPTVPGPTVPGLPTLESSLEISGTIAGVHLSQALPPSSDVLSCPAPADGLSDRLHQSVQPAVLAPRTHRIARDGSQRVAPPPLRPAVFACGFPDDPNARPIRPALYGPVPQEDGTGHAARPPVAGSR